MVEPIRPTLELLEHLKNAQLRHASQMAADRAQRGISSDDDYQDLSSALRLAAYLVDLEYESDLEKFGALLNDTSLQGAGLMKYASDGICREIYDTNPPSLSDDGMTNWSIR
ncbi:hypothetical protein [Bradyrhizobium sp. 142]|uniref:hypothetical protein n=1 Tax=Bradyrhizobium sp. 142 TaxID=2782618 RepID=UPI001FFBC1A8|nr:hypothetical protein [Bradyrhizobium sp. 142]MCK1724142.1 hypothetical protein [Bradyrhizobium sp. 142]